MQDNLFTSSFKIYTLKFIIFMIAIIIAVVCIGKKYSLSSTQNIVNAFSEKRFKEFYSLSKNSLDLVFLGSSHSYCTFDPNLFKDFNSYQMGMPLQYMDSTYYTLKEVLNYQIPKVIVLEVYWDLLQNDFELNQIKTLFQVLKNNNLKDEYIKKYFPLDEKIKYNINLFKYQQDYFAYEGNNLKTRIENKFNIQKEQIQKQIGVEKYKKLGYVYSNYQMLESEYNKTNQFKKLDGKDVKFSKKQLKFLDKIINLTNEKNIKLIFVTAPIANVSMEYIKNYDYIHDKVNKIAEANKIPYLDYNIINREENVLQNENFRDDAHLNNSGVQIVSKHFENFLKENNILN